MMQLSYFSQTLLCALSLSLKNSHTQAVKMPSVIPGFANITGIFGCFNHCILDPVHKPKTITFDAKIPIGDDDSGRLNCVKGILHYFVPSHESFPSNNNKYFVSGKITSISQSESDEKTTTDYDLQVEALTVRTSFNYSIIPFFMFPSKLFLLSDVYDPPKSQVIIAGQVISLFYYRILLLKIRTRQLKE